MTSVCKTASCLPSASRASRGESLSPQAALTQSRRKTIAIFRMAPRFERSGPTVRRFPRKKQYPPCGRGGNGDVAASADDLDDRAARFDMLTQLLEAIHVVQRCL